MPVQPVGNGGHTTSTLQTTIYVQFLRYHLHTLSDGTHVYGVNGRFRSTFNPKHGIPIPSEVGRLSAEHLIAYLGYKDRATENAKNNFLKAQTNAIRMMILSMERVDGK